MLKKTAHWEFILGQELCISHMTLMVLMWHQAWHQYHNSPFLIDEDIQAYLQGLSSWQGRQLKEKAEIEKQNHISILNHLSENQSFKINKNVYLSKKKLRLNKLSSLFKDAQ